MYGICFDEIWVKINCFDIKDMYYISNYGEVKNESGKILSLSLSNGYLTVALQLNNSTRRTFYAHILVAMMFIYNDDPINKTQVNHKDLCRSHNYILNLEWCTPLENIQHEIQNRELKIHNESFEKLYIKNKGWGSGSSTFGENNGMSKWDESQVHNICRAVQDGKSYEEALILTGMENTPNNRYNVSHIVRGHRWKYISSQYNFN